MLLEIYMFTLLNKLLMYKFREKNLYFRLTTKLKPTKKTDWYCTLLMSDYWYQVPSYPAHCVIPTLNKLTHLQDDTELVEHVYE